MPLNGSESEVYQALSQVRHPEIHSRNLVELGMIPEVKIEGQRVSVVLALPTLEASLKGDLVVAVHQVVSGAVPGWRVKVNPVEMDADQRRAFQAILREELIVAPKDDVRINQVLAVMSGKGGVGKSSIAGLLACSLRKRHLRVGILDADITGPSIPKLFGVRHLPFAGPQAIQPAESQEGIKLMSINLLLPDEGQPVVWRGPLISRVIQQFWSEIDWGDLDVLIVDLPPGTSDASLTVMQSLPLDGIILVASPQDLAGMVVRKAANMAASLEVALVGLVENMSYLVCPQCGTKLSVFGDSHAGETAAKIGTRLLGYLPLDPQLSTLCDQGAIEAYHSDVFEEITDRVFERASIREPLLGQEGG